MVSVFVTDSTDVILDINGYFAPFGHGGLAYSPVTPYRVAETRAGSGFSGACGTPLMASGVSRTFPVPSSACGIPSAGAYVLNFTAVPSGALGYLSTGPAGAAQPNVSTLNSWNGQVVANMAIVSSATTGAISTWVSGSTDLVLDVTGYFQP